MKKKALLTLTLALMLSCSSAFAWRYTPAALVTNIIPFPGSGFDVLPRDMTGISGCTELRVQKGVLGLTESDVRSYLAMVLTANVADKKLSFIINDADCYVYRIIFA